MNLYTYPLILMLAFSPVQVENGQEAVPRIRI